MLRPGGESPARRAGDGEFKTLTHGPPFRDTAVGRATDRAPVQYTVDEANETCALVNAQLDLSPVRDAGDLYPLLVD